MALLPWMRVCLNEYYALTSRERMYFYDATSVAGRVPVATSGHSALSPTKGPQVEQERQEVGAPSTSATDAGSSMLSAREMLAPLEGDLSNLTCNYALDSFDTDGNQPVCGRPAVKRAYLDDGFIFPMDYCRMHWNRVSDLPVVQAGEIIDLSDEA